MVAPALAATTGAAPIACRSLDQLGATHMFDYNDSAYASNLKLVESYHFNSGVRSLSKGQSSTVPGDLDFVLRAVPNHYEALSAMGRWQLLNGSPRSGTVRYEPADCYFQRASAFRPSDPRVHLVYGIYLHQAKRLLEAGQQYTQAEAMGWDDAELYYNFGLLLVDTGDIPRARRYAEKAYALGYPLPGLKNKLSKYPDR